MGQTRKWGYFGQVSSCAIVTMDRFYHRSDVAYFIKLHCDMWSGAFNSWTTSRVQQLTSSLANFLHLYVRTYVCFAFSYALLALCVLMYVLILQRRLQWAKQQLLSKKVRETDMVCTATSVYSLRRTQEIPRRKYVHGQSVEATHLVSVPLQSLLPGGHWGETGKTPCDNNSSNQEALIRTPLESHRSGDSIPLSPVLCNTTSCSTLLDSDDSTVSLAPHCSCLKDSSNTSLKAPLIPSGKRELQRREEVRRHLCFLVAQAVHMSIRIHIHACNICTCIHTSGWCSQGHCTLLYCFYVHLPANVCNFCGLCYVRTVLLVDNTYDMGCVQDD